MAREVSVDGEGEGEREGEGEEGEEGEVDEGEDEEVVVEEGGGRRERKLSARRVSDLRLEWRDEGESLKEETM